MDASKSRTPSTEGMPSTEVTSAIKESHQYQQRQSDHNWNAKNRKDDGSNSTDDNSSRNTSEAGTPTTAKSFFLLAVLSHIY